MSIPPLQEPPQAEARHVGWIHSTLAAVVILVALSLAVRLPRLDRPVFVDELLHVLAARSLVEDGTLHIYGDAIYTRARLFTYLIAGMFRVFGESLLVARVPALIMGIASVIALFLWVRSIASPLAAWTAALLFCLNPEAIYLSQWCRFYTFHSFFLFLGAIGTYTLLRPGVARKRRIWLAAGVTACLALAFHLQLLTVVSILALAVWVASSVIPLAAARPATPRRKWIALGVGAVLLVTAWLVHASGFAAYAWKLFDFTPPWSEANLDTLLFYHRGLLRSYAVFWSLFPLAFLVAVSVHARPTWFCGCVFGTGLVVHSLAGQTSDRYIFWAMPFFFAVIGMAFDPACSWTRERLRMLLGPPGGRFSRPAAARFLVYAFLSATVAFAAAGNGAFLRTFALVAGGEFRRFEGGRTESDWGAAAPILRRLAEDAEVLLSSDAPKSLYFLDRLDFFFRRRQELVATLRSPSDFAVHETLGIPVVTTPEALQRLMALHSSGLVVVEKSHWGRQVPPELGEYLQTHAEQVELPQEWRLFVFRWDPPHAESRR